MLSSLLDQLSKSVLALYSKKTYYSVWWASHNHKQRHQTAAYSTVIEKSQELYVYNKIINSFVTKFTAPNRRWFPFEGFDLHYATESYELL